MSKVIVISGLTAGGKTTLIKALAQKLTNSEIISFDDYDIDQLPSAPSLSTPLSESVNQYDITEIVQAVKSARTKFDYVLVDFPFGNRHNSLTSLINLTVYIKTPLDLLLARQILRDYSTSELTDILDWLKTYIRIARSIFLANEQFVSSSADLILDGSSSLPLKVDSVLKKLQRDKF
ncbi:nucleoside/nucleotide kinase family protein [Oenococcus oeni]|uniref:Uridine kinase n=1 Tax=Oenococcus oeni TaxID=1247 RepID=A0AAQ2URH2_OENOE|nr:adenylylsulfate kinase [Oenococcus oeni]SYW05187.1 putative Uridine kinase [Oenococcus oeni]SYW05911.1 putative Uridine kinase [Oenococcus oeni]SYW13200.1 putative Uridine kinase [Oenococcus oeni]SYW15712.1 putative Uridine kinase [Oenococcus oeni]SYW20081.1 putative Uridine kinase [Oenococcus oeni]